MDPPRAYEAPAVVETFVTLISMSLYPLLSTAQLTRRLLTDTALPDLFRKDGSMP